MRVEEDDACSDRPLTHAELRQEKSNRLLFPTLPRRPITLVLDRVRQSYNIGAIFRLCDAFLVERLIICGDAPQLHNRKLVQAARGTQHWVPWNHTESSVSAVTAAKAAGQRIVVVEQTNAGVRPEGLQPASPICLVFGAERDGVLPEIVKMADAAVTIPMLGMANSINVATSAAIILHCLSMSYRDGDGAFGMQQSRVSS